MRKRAIRARKEEPDFVMEQRSEKSHLRDDSTHSHSSTRKLVSGAELSSVKKETMTSVREVGQTSFDLFPADQRNSAGLGIDVAKSPVLNTFHSRETSTASHNPSGPPLIPSVAVRNFSRGPSRPSTAVRETGSIASQFSQDRRVDSPDARPSTSNDVRGRPPPSRDLSLQSNSAGPRLPPKSQVGQSNLSGGRNSPANATSSTGPRPPPSRQQAPPSAFPSTNRPSQQPKPKPVYPSPTSIQTEGRFASRHMLNPPTPTGAYNGASPISQYSPIIKDGMNFETALTSASPDSRPQEAKSSRKAPPSAIKTSNSPSAQQTSDFSEENMRIARLADSSRLGFYPTKSPNTVNEQPTILEPPSPSPRLPPPATRDAPPSNMNIPIPPTPTESTLPSPDSRRVDSFAPDRKSVRSMISRLSSDDGYVDMEIDAKSDVSSLDDRERWQMEQSSRNGSRAGTGLGMYGANGAIKKPPPLVQRPGAESAASGSMYSLGKY